MKIDQSEHMARIGAVLAALGDVSVALGIVTLEDVMVALQLGLQAGVDLPTIRRVNEELLAKERGRTH